MDDVINKMEFENGPGQFPGDQTVISAPPKKKEIMSLITQEYFYKLISIADDIVWIMSLDAKRIFYINPSFERLYGKSIFDLRSNPNLWLDAIHPDDRQIAVDSLNELFISGFTQKEYRIITPAGSTVWLHEKKHIIQDELGKSIQIGCIARDITEHKATLDRLNEYKNHLQALTEKLSLTEEMERRRIALNLHDHAIQNLAYCKIRLDEFSKQTPDSPARKTIYEIRDIVTETINDIRTLTFELSPPVLYEHGLESAIEWLGEIILMKRGISFRLINENFEDNLSQEMRILLFQVIREILNNAAKHSKASESVVRISGKGDNLFISILDDGIGFNPGEIKNKKTTSYGFFSIQERLSNIGGFFNIVSKPGNGTKIDIIVPLKNPALFSD
jgi:PAS domain S-box-containing protein